jgi:Lar family restriction alleviation protein
MPDASELKPCPFCGDEHASIHPVGGSPEYWVVCDNLSCSANGGMAGTRERAAVRWNRRGEDE